MASASDFEVNQTEVKGGCQLGRKVVTNDSKSDLPLAPTLPAFWQISLVARSNARSASHIYRQAKQNASSSNAMALNFGVEFKLLLKIYYIY